MPRVSTSRPPPPPLRPSVWYRCGFGGVGCAVHVRRRRTSVLVFDCVLLSGCLPVASEVKGHHFTPSGLPPPGRRCVWSSIHAPRGSQPLSVRGSFSRFLLRIVFWSCLPSRLRQRGPPVPPKAAFEYAPRPPPPPHGPVSHFTNFFRPPVHQPCSAPAAPFLPRPPCPRSPCGGHGIRVSSNDTFPN